MFGGIRNTSVYVAEQMRGTEISLFAYFELDDDVVAVHPYMHARTTACRHRSNPPYVRFYWQGKACVLYRSSALVGLFQNKEQAEEFGAQLAVMIRETYRDRAQILPDEPNAKPPTALEILRILPRNNCQKCGFATCLAFAVAATRAEVNPWACPSFPQPREGRFSFLVPGEQESQQFTLRLEHPHATAVGAIAREASAQADSALLDVGNISALSERELQVLELMALGFSNKEIAQNLGISPHTVKTHSIHIFEKLDCTDRTQASVWASRAGLV